MRWSRRTGPWLVGGLALLVASTAHGEPVIPPTTAAPPAAAAVVAEADLPPVIDGAALAAAERAREARAARRHWLQLGLAGFVVCAVLGGIWLAHRGHMLPIRPIAGLVAFEEAVSRATEMGRPTMFTTGGCCDLKRIQLFGAMPLLREAARLSGELGNRMIVPVAFPETVPVHIHAVRDGLADASAIEQFRPEDLRFLPGGQFFFAMAAMGWMLEERPATCLYFGHWEADSLMFAETGQAVNAMQIAGTDQLYQVPFFLAACDYTIIGEEFWAASATISRDPPLVGCLGAQDICKLAILAFIIGGTVLVAWGPFANLVVLLQDTFTKG